MGEGIIQFQRSLETFVSRSSYFSASSANISVVIDKQTASMDLLTENARLLNNLAKELSSAFNI